MNLSDITVISIAWLSQVWVAIFALRLTRHFGVARVGWSLFSAFTLLALVHLVQATTLFTRGSRLGIEVEVIYALISFLLLIGLAHIQSVMLQRRQMERQMQKLESIGQLTVGIAHDFNNILTVIQGHACLLGLRQCDPEITAQLNEISTAVDRASSLTRQLLMFGKRQSSPAEPLDLNAVIGNLTQMLRRLIGEHITLKSLYAPDLPTIIGSLSMIEQVVLNLVVNARDAMPKGGVVTVSTEAVTVDENHVEDHPEARLGEFVCVRVADTGTGMPPEVLARVFDPFFTTKAPEKGTGLGLATVQRIVKQNSGWVEVKSQVGVGTEFAVYFQSVPDRIKEKPKEYVSTRPSGGTETILLVEDDQSVCRLTSSLLKQNGYRVLEADCGVTALEIWKDRASEVDLLITDMVMPGGISGRDLADYVLKFKPGLKIVCTSGYRQNGADQDSAPKRNVRFMPKPYTHDNLLRTVRESLCADCAANGHGDSQRIVREISPVSSS